VLHATPPVLDMNAEFFSFRTVLFLAVGHRAMFATRATGRNRQQPRVFNGLHFTALAT
jgi:hypothetical protein